MTRSKKQFFSVKIKFLTGQHKAIESGKLNGLVKRGKAQGALHRYDVPASTFADPDAAEQGRSPAPMPADWQPKSQRFKL